MHSTRISSYNLTSSERQYILICSKTAVASLQWTEVRDQTEAPTHTTTQHGSEMHNDSQKQGKWFASYKTNSNMPLSDVIPWLITEALTTDFL